MPKEDKDPFAQYVVPDEEQPDQGADPFAKYVIESDDDPFKEYESDPGFFEKGGSFDAGAKGAAQMLTFGYSDEIIAAMRSAFGDRTYDEEKKIYDEEMAHAQRHSPTAYDVGTGLGIAGSLVASGGAGLIKEGAKAGLKKAATSTAGKAIGKHVTKDRVKGVVKDLVIEAGLEQMTGIPGLGVGIKGMKALLKKGKISQKVFDLWMKKYGK